ncbi:MAG TPA: response regulator [Nitrososphaeraceae archaeon]
MPEDYYHNNQFRLVLLDYKMPHITGCELANKIADINPRIKMVLITAVNDIIKNKLKLELIQKPLRMHNFYL